MSCSLLVLPRWDVASVPLSWGELGESGDQITGWRLFSHPFEEVPRPLWLGVFNMAQVHNNGKITKTFLLVMVSPKIGSELEGRYGRERKQSTEGMEYSIKSISSESNVQTTNSQQQIETRILNTNLELFHSCFLVDNMRWPPVSGVLGYSVTVGTIGRLQTLTLYNMIFSKKSSILIMQSDNVWCFGKKIRNYHGLSPLPQCIFSTRPLSSFV